SRAAAFWFVVIYGDFGSPVKYDRNTGARIWVGSGCDGFLNIPVYHTGRVYLRNISGEDCILDAGSGLNSGAFESDTPPVFWHDLAFYVVAGELRAVDQQSGSTRWTFGAGERLVTAPLAVQGYLNIGTRNGWLLALAAASGR